MWLRCLIVLVILVGTNSRWRFFCPTGGSLVSSTGGRDSSSFSLCIGLSMIKSSSSLSDDYPWIISRKSTRAVRSSSLLLVTRAWSSISWHGNQVCHETIICFLSDLRSAVAAFALWLILPWIWINRLLLHLLKLCNVGYTIANKFITANTESTNQVYSRQSCFRFLRVCGRWASRGAIGRSRTFKLGLNPGFDVVRWWSSTSD